MAFGIFEFCKKDSISVNVQWIPREENEKADYLSKLIDYDDWGVSDDFFEYIDSIWGPHTVDRFANANNKKICRFNSVFWNPGSEAVDCFWFIHDHDFRIIGERFGNFDHLHLGNG